MSAKKVLVLGGAGRVGMQIASEMMRRNYDLVIADIVNQELLENKTGRLLNDASLATGSCSSALRVYGGLDALDKPALTQVMVDEQPDLVINYAIPITWDATKRLSNYVSLSAAGLGAFTPIQVVTPLLVGQAIAESGIDAKYMVGNLPDITIPIITGIANNGGVARPACGAGNVGLNQIAFRRQIALEREVDFEDVELSLVSHHVHWVAPREPGYSNEAPFLAQVLVHGEDVTDSFDDLRAAMNRGVRNHYEADAAFSSTTGILASRIALALLDESAQPHYLHAPAPNGLPGGYPVQIQNGEVAVNLPESWQLAGAVTAMNVCHTLDGVQTIEADGTVVFTESARLILKREIGFELPAIMTMSDIETVARAQIDVLTRLM